MEEWLSEKGNKGVSCFRELYATGYGYSAAMVADLFDDVLRVSWCRDESEDEETGFSLARFQDFRITLRLLEGSATGPEVV